MIGTRRGVAAILLAALVAAAPATFADDHGDTAEGSDYHHMIALFGGGTHEEGNEALTYGVEYIFGLVDHRVAVGALLERAESPIDGTLLFGLVHFDPVANLYFSLGVGGERRHGHTLTVVRVGVGYHFDVSDRWVVAPEINLDIADREEAIVYGVNFGYRF